MADIFVDQFLKPTCARIASDMAQWAKENHGWENQTMRLEAHITPFVRVEGKKIIFGIGETMDYGVYVEAIKDKGVLQPAYEHFKPIIEKEISVVSAAWASKELAAGNAGD